VHAQVYARPLDLPFAAASDLLTGCRIVERHLAGLNFEIGLGPR